MVFVDISICRSASMVFNPLSHEVRDPARVELFERKDHKFGKRMLSTEVEQTMKVCIFVCSRHTGLA